MALAALSQQKLESRWREACYSMKSDHRTPTCRLAYPGSRSCLLACDGRCGSASASVGQHRATRDPFLLAVADAVVEAGLAGSSAAAEHCVFA